MTVAIHAYMAVVPALILQMGMVLSLNFTSVLSQYYARPEILSLQSSSLEVKIF